MVDNQRVTHPQRWRTAAVMTQRWRLVRARGETVSELFDIQSDPGQQTDVADRHPEVAEKLNKTYGRWWQSWEDARTRPYEITIGSDAEKTAMLTADRSAPTTCTSGVFEMRRRYLFFTAENGGPIMG